jgi:hypothetical protein
MSDQSGGATDERWYELGLALVAEGFEHPRLVDDELRERLKRVLRRTYSDDRRDRRKRLEALDE